MKEMGDASHPLEIIKNEVISSWRTYQDPKIPKNESIKSANTIVKIIASDRLSCEVVGNAIGGFDQLSEMLAKLLANKVLAMPKSKQRKVSTWLDSKELSVREITLCTYRLAVLLHSHGQQNVSAIKLILASLLTILRGVAKYPAAWVSIPPLVTSVSHENFCSSESEDSGSTHATSDNIDTSILYTPVPVSGLSLRPDARSAASDPAPNYANQPFTHLIFRTLRAVLDIPWASGWDSGMCAEFCLNNPSNWLPLIEILPTTVIACLIGRGQTLASAIRDEWVATITSLVRLTTISCGGALLLPSTGTNIGLVDVSLEIAGFLIEQKPPTADIAGSNILSAMSFLEATLNCIVASLPYSKILVTSFEKRMGYTVLSNLLRRFGDGFENKPFDCIREHHLLQLVHIPLILLAISGAPMLTATAVEEFVILGGMVLKNIDMQVQDPWKKIWGVSHGQQASETDPITQSYFSDEDREDSDAYRSASPLSLEECQLSVSFSSSEPEPDSPTAFSFTIPASYVSLDTATLPWCNGQAFGLLIHAFAGCQVDHRLRKLLLHCLLFALVRFPRQYLRQSDSDALWYYHPVLVISSFYHIDMDTQMQNSFLSCIAGLCSHAMRQINDTQRMTGWNHSVLDDALIFDLRCIAQLLHPPITDTPLTLASDGCGKWFLEGIERVIAIINKLDNVPGIYPALRRAGLCEAIAKLLMSGFAWGNPPFIANVLNVLYRQCKRDSLSVRQILDNCCNIMPYLYTLMSYLIPSTPGTFSHYRAVCQVIQLLCSEYDVVSDLLIVCEVAPIGLSIKTAIKRLEDIQCKHCQVASPSAKSERGGMQSRDLGERVFSMLETESLSGSSAPDCAVPSPSVDRCMHRQHSHIDNVEVEEAQTVPPTQLKKAMLRRRIALTIIKLIHKTPNAADDFIANRGFNRIADSCERDSTLIQSILIDENSTSRFRGVSEDTTPMEAMDQQARSFEMSESGLSDKADGRDLFWVLHGNLLTYITLATAAATNSAGTQGVEDSGLCSRLGDCCKLFCKPELPGSRMLLSLSLLRLAIHSTTLPTPEIGSQYSVVILKHHDVPPSIVVPQLPVDQHHLWLVHHPSAISAALALSLPEIGYSHDWWTSSSMLHIHTLGIVSKIIGSTIHNVFELHRSGFLESLFESLLPLLKARKDPELSTATFTVVKKLGRKQCCPSDVRKLLQQTGDPVIWEECLDTLLEWAKTDSPYDGGPHHFMSFLSNWDDEQPGGSKREIQSSFAMLPRLACSPWPQPQRGYAMSLWVRYEVLDNAPVSCAVLCSSFAHEESISLVTDICLNSTSDPGLASLSFRISMSDDSDVDGSPYYTASPTHLQHLKPQRWYHIVVTHHIDVTTHSKNSQHVLEVKINGGLTEGTESKAIVAVPYDKRDRFKKFAKKGGRLSCVILGASLIDYLGTDREETKQMGSAQRISALLESEEIMETLRLSTFVSSFATFQLGPMFVFWGSITSWQAYILFVIGRDYCGDFNEPLVNYSCHGILNTKVCTATRMMRESASHWLSQTIKKADGLTPTSKSDLTSLHDKLLMIINTRNGRSFVSSRVVFGAREKQLRPTPTPTPVQTPLSAPMLSPTSLSHGNQSIALPTRADDDDATDVQTLVSETPDTKRRTLPASVPVILASADIKIQTFTAIQLSIGGATHCESCTTYKGLLKSVGGMNHAVSLVSLSHNHETRVKALELIVSLMRYSPENSQEMIAEGFSSLAWYLKKDRVIIDAQVLNTCFMLTGIDHSIDTNGLNKCLLYDITAVRLVLLDWGIWSRGSESVHSALLTRFTTLITSHPLGRAHRHILIHAGIFPWILRQIHTDTSYPYGKAFSPNLRTVVTDLLAALSGISWIPKSIPCMPSIESSLKYIISTALPLMSSQSVISTNTVENKWRRSVLQLLVVLLSRCGDKELTWLVNDHKPELFISLLSECCPRSRFHVLTIISVLVKHAGPRQAFQNIGFDVLHQYCHLLRTGVPPHHLDALEPSTLEIQMLLLLLIRGPANTRRGSSDAPVRQPIATMLFLKSFGGFISNALTSTEARVLCRTACEVLAMCGIDGYCSTTSQLHAHPGQEVYRSFSKPEMHHMREIESDSLGQVIEPTDSKLLRDISEKMQSLISSGDLPKSITGSFSYTTERFKIQELAMPELLSTLAHMTAYALSPRAGTSPLVSANLRFKRSLLADALRQAFLHGSSSVKAKYVEKHIHLLAATFLHPPITQGDAGFAWLSLRLMVDIVAWGAASSPDTSSSLGDATIPYPDLVHQSLDTIALLGAETTGDPVTVVRWIQHLQQHLLHAVLLKFRNRLVAWNERNTTLISRFVAFSETCIETIHTWRVAKGGRNSPGRKTKSSDSPTEVNSEVFKPLSELLQEEIDFKENLGLLKLLQSMSYESEESDKYFYLNLLSCRPIGRSRSNAIRDPPANQSALEIVWLIPEIIKSRASERLMAYDWFMEDKKQNAAAEVSGEQSPTTRKRSQTINPTPFGSTEREDLVLELQGAPENVSSFIFWLFETIHMGVGCAVAMRNNRSNFPLRDRLSRKSSGAEAILTKHMRKLLLEMSASFSLRVRHPLMPPPEVCTSFALTTLLHSNAMDSTELETLKDPSSDIWCSQWWIPVVHSLPQSCLLVLFGKNDDDPSFIQLLWYNISPRLRQVSSIDRTQLVKVVQYLIEVKSSTIRKAVIAGMLPTVEAIQSTKKGRDRSLPPSLLVSLLLATESGGGLSTLQADSKYKTVPMNPSEDRLLQPSFVGKIKRYNEKAEHKLQKHRQERLSLIRTRLQEIGITGRSHSAAKNRITVHAELLLSKRFTAFSKSARGIQLSKSREKDARGTVGRLVRSRVMLQDFWGRASAIHTKRSINSSLKWRLDDAEGPDRIRIRLKRFLAQPLVEELQLVESDVVNESAINIFHESHHVETNSNTQTNPHDDDELVALLDHHFEPGMHGHEEGMSGTGFGTFPCAQVTPMVKLDGELVLFQKTLYYISNDSPYRDDLERINEDTATATDCDSPTQSPKSPEYPFSKEDAMMKKQVKQHMVHKMHLHTVKHRVAIWYSEVSGLFKRRYLLRNNSIEVFTERGLAFLFSFDSEVVRENVYQIMLSQCPRAKEMSLTAENLKRWRDRWQNGRISNFQYLMYINTMAGRSFNDLTQYPIFPHILSDYTSDAIDLSNPAVYRDLSRPMGCQTEERRRKCTQKYQQTLEMHEMQMSEIPQNNKKRGNIATAAFRLGNWGLGKKSDTTEVEEEVNMYALPPYHHGSHFSNRATVLYYCIRLQPFTDYFCELNDLKLDVPDRTFHSIQRAWKLSSAVSTTDVKELTPEFFYLPDFLVNTGKIKLGVKQDSVAVNHTELPPWAEDNPRLFVTILRKALEGEHCSKQLHNWIDLTFGYKTNKEPAVEAMNCFHPYAYEGAVNIDAITDPVRRQSTIDIINNFGQMPQQLFTKAHPKRTIEKIFGSKDTSWWQGKSTRKICEAMFSKLQDSALTVVRAEMRKGVVRSIRVVGGQRESATTRCIDGVAEDDTGDEIYAVPDCRTLLVHASFEGGGEGTVGMDSAPAECLQYLNWDNSIKIQLYDEGRQGREVLSLRHSCRVDNITCAATSVTDASHIAFGSDTGAIEIYRYGLHNNSKHKQQPNREAWEVEGDNHGFRFIIDEQSDSQPSAITNTIASTLNVHDLDGKQRTIRMLAVLHGHTKSVLSLVISKEFNVIVSGAQDGIIIIWDLLDLTFIRRMSPITETHAEPEVTCSTWGPAAFNVDMAERCAVLLVDINPITGDVIAATAEKPHPRAQASHQLNLWNINGVVLSCKKLDDIPTCIQFTGTLVTIGCLHGKILLLSAFDLSTLCPPLCPGFGSPITALSINESHTKLYSSHQSISPSGSMQSILSTWMVTK